jgi:hypothetical protein
MTVKRELGSFPSDYEPWFDMWDSVLFLPNADAKNIPLYKHVDGIGTIPCHQHRFCKALVRAESKYPPRVCPHCKVDTLKEAKEQKVHGSGVILDGVRTS